MRLINTGAGEITDRLTILTNKILYGQEVGKDVSHFLSERAALLTRLRSRDLNGSWFEHALDLSAVNAALWRAEDELRDWRKRFELRAVSDVEEPAARHLISLIAFRIQSLNDRRGVLVAQINRLTGEFLGEEKL